MMFVEYFVGFKIITSFPLGCHSGNDKHQKMTFSSKDRKKAHQVKDKMKQGRVILISDHVQGKWSDGYLLLDPINTASNVKEIIKSL